MKRAAPFALFAVLTISACLKEPVPLDLESAEDWPVVAAEQDEGARTWEDVIERWDEYSGRDLDAASDCPTVRYPEISPRIHAGATFDRIAAHLGRRVTELAMADHPATNSGVRFFHAYNFSSACMMGYSHANCFITDRDVYCSGVEGDLERFVADQGFDRMLGPPTHESRISFSDETWFELVATFAAAHYRLTSAASKACPGTEGIAPRNLRAKVGAKAIEVTIVDGGDNTVRHALEFDPKLRHHSVQLRDGLGDAFDIPPAL